MQFSKRSQTLVIGSGLQRNEAVLGHMLPLGLMVSAEYIIMAQTLDDLSGKM